MYFSQLEIVAFILDTKMVLKGDTRHFYTYVSLEMELCISFYLFSSSLFFAIDFHTFLILEKSLNNDKRSIYIGTNYYLLLKSSVTVD